MEYGIKELSRLAGVSARTLRYYDEIGLLKPSRVSDAGYRHYSQKEVAVLQQILFYRERGFDLKTVQKIIYDKDFDMLEAMEKHLLALEDQKAATEALIQTVKKTIQHMKGVYTMSDKERFQTLKEKKLRENETKYGAQARQKYGADRVEATNRKMMVLTDAQFQSWQELGEEILCRLEAGVKAGIRADSGEAETIATLHRQWLSTAMSDYSPSIHKGIAVMYIADERFTTYYDRNTEGCARLLNDAVRHWI